MTTKTIFQRIRDNKVTGKILRVGYVGSLISGIALTQFAMFKQPPDRDSNKTTFINYKKAR